MAAESNVAQLAPSSFFSDVFEQLFRAPLSSFVATFHLQVFSMSNASQSVLYEGLSRSPRFFAAFSEWLDELIDSQVQHMRISSLYVVDAIRPYSEQVTKVVLSRDSVHLVLMKVMKEVLCVLDHGTLLSHIDTPSSLALIRISRHIDGVLMSLDGSTLDMFRLMRQLLLVLHSTANMCTQSSSEQEESATTDHQPLSTAPIPLDVLQQCVDSDAPVLPVPVAVIDPVIKKHAYPCWLEYHPQLHHQHREDTCHYQHHASFREYVVKHTVESKVRMRDMKSDFTPEPLKSSQGGSSHEILRSGSVMIWTLRFPATIELFRAWKEPMLHRVLTTVTGMHRSLISVGNGSISDTPIKTSDSALADQSKQVWAGVSFCKITDTTKNSLIDVLALLGDSGYFHLASTDDRKCMLKTFHRVYGITPVQSLVDQVVCSMHLMCQTMPAVEGMTAIWRKLHDKVHQKRRSPCSPVSYCEQFRLAVVMKSQWPEEYGPIVGVQWKDAPVTCRTFTPYYEPEHDNDKDALRVVVLPIPALLFELVVIDCSTNENRILLDPRDLKRVSGMQHVGWYRNRVDNETKPIHQHLEETSHDWVLIAGSGTTEACEALIQAVSWWFDVGLQQSSLVRSTAHLRHGMEQHMMDLGRVVGPKLNWCESNGKLQVQQPSTKHNKHTSRAPVKKQPGHELRLLTRRASPCVGYLRSQSTRTCVYGEQCGFQHITYATALHDALVHDSFQNSSLGDLIAEPFQVLVRFINLGKIGREDDAKTNFVAGVHASIPIPLHKHETMIPKPVLELFSTRLHLMPVFFTTQVGRSLDEEQHPATRSDRWLRWNVSGDEKHVCVALQMVVWYIDQVYPTTPDVSLSLSQMHLVTDHLSMTMEQQHCHSYACNKIDKSEKMRAFGEFTSHINELFPR